MRGRSAIVLGLSALLVASLMQVIVAATPAGAATYSETTGGAANTWTNYTNAGGTKGPTIAAFQTVQITCALTGFRVADGNTWWYQIASSPWNNIYYVSADAFYNNGRTSGSLHGTPFVDPAVPACSSLTNGSNETTGGAAQTWTNYTNAGGTQGPTIASHQTVKISCALTGFRVADGNTWWYRIASAPWTNLYYVSADAFYNNGRTSGSLIGTPWVDPSVPQCSGGGGTPGTGMNEQEGHYGVNTFANYQNASGPGPRISPAAVVQISCKVYDGTIASVNPDGYWYRIASSPWNNQYYAPANTFMNGDPWGGPYSHNTDFSVPDCGNTPKPGGPTVSLARGPAAVYGYWYAVTLSGFPAGSSVAVTCYDTVTRGGWGTVRLPINGSGTASTQGGCYSGDGPDHWVIANGVASNHVSWASGSGGGGTSGISSTRAGNQGSVPPKSQKSTTCHVTVYPVNCATGDFWHSFTDFSIPGRGVPLDFSHTYTSSAAGVSGRLGFGWTDSYNMSLSTNGNTVTVTEENGATVSFTSDGNGGFTPPSYVLASLVSNPDGTYTFTRAHSNVRYVFSQFGQLLSEIDRNGYTTTLSYTGIQLTSITDPASRSLSLAYNGSQISQITDPLGRSESFTYNEAGDLTSVTDAGGGVWRFTYDANHLLLTMTDPRGGVVTNVYGAEGRVVSQTDPAGFTTTWSYSGDNASVSGGTTTLTDPNGIVTTYDYENLELQSVTNAYGTSLAATTSYAYDSNTLGITATTDPNGHITKSTYDSEGNVLSKTDGLGNRTSYTYNSFNEPLTQSDPLGNVTSYVYDANGNLLTKTDPLGDKTTYSYGDSSHPGDVTAVTDPDNHTTHLSYDAAGNLANQTDPLGDVTAYGYDAAGRRTGMISPRGLVKGANVYAFLMLYSYDTDNNLLSTQDQLGHVTTNTYDLNDNLTSTTDPSGHKTTYSYDADNERTTTHRADGTTLLQAYDGAGSEISQTDGAGNVTAYAYDGLGRKISQTTPDGRVTYYSYDAVGNQTSLTDPAGRVTTNTYDAANELTATRYSGAVSHVLYGYDVLYAYDADGHRTGMLDSTGITTYSYDTAGRLTSSTNGAGAKVAYVYDPAGNLTSLTYPDGHAVSRTFDAAGRMTKVTDWLGHTTTFGYDADGNETVEQYPNGVAASSSYDTAGNLTGIIDHIGVYPIANYVYTRNADELVAADNSAQLGQPAQSHAYSYTPLSQVSSDGTNIYKYDPADNLTNAASLALHYNTADELTSANIGYFPLGYTDDSQGNRTSTTTVFGTTNYGYDQANRLSSYKAGTTTATYAYNADGLRMSKTVNGAAESFAYDTSGDLPLILMDGNTSYIYGPDDLPIEQVNGGTVLYYHHDQLGSTRFVTNADATAIVASYNYDAYGNVTSSSGSIANPFRFAGQYTDTENGLLYLRARYYDPYTGQFLSVDPEAATTRAPYGYANNDPVNAGDPTGRWTAFICAGGDFHFGIGITGQLCHAEDTNGNVGDVILVGWGIGVGAGGGVYAVASSSNLVAGWDRGLDASAAAFCGAGVDYSPDQVIANPNATCGGVDIKADAHAGFHVTYTWITSTRRSSDPSSRTSGPGCGPVSQAPTGSGAYLQGGSVYLQGGY